jgi:hypothetical protein
MQALTPRIEASPHRDAGMVALILQGARDIRQPHRALLILLALGIRKVLLARPR